MTQSKIKELFASLTKSEQVELLKELNSNSATSISITEFSQKHQQRYGSNIEFQVIQTGLDHAPIITAILTTAYGKFRGAGSNQKIAKANAIEKAAKNWKH